MIDINTSSLDQINAELGLSGFPSDNTDLIVARRALRAVYREIGLVFTPAKIVVYWGKNKQGEESWMFVAKSDFDNVIDQDSLDGLDPNDLDLAICETIRILGMDLTSDMFATGNEDGGFAVWESGLASWDSIL